MKKNIIIVVLLISALYVHAQIPVDITINGIKLPGTGHFAFQASGIYSSPQRMLADSYESSFGFGFGIGLAITPLGINNLHVGSISLNYSKEFIQLKNTVARNFNISENTTASLSSIHLGWGVGVPIVFSKSFFISPYLNAGIGGTSFSIEENVYEKFGKSTLSELKGENRLTQLSYYRQLGLIFSGIEHISLNYSYSFFNVERAWMFWHLTVSGIIHYAASYSVPFVLNLVLPDKVLYSLPYSLVILAYQITASIISYNLDYKYHNWPYNDDPPLRYHRQMLTLNYYF